MEELSYLSLVSKVAQELDNHLGISDKTLAEFIIDLADTHGEPAAFHTALVENGAEVAKSFATNLLAIIQKMRPAKAAAASKGAGSTKAALSKGMGQLSTKMSLFGKDMSSKLEAKLEEARVEARERAAERDRLRADQRAKAEAAAAALPPLPPMG